MGSVSPTCPLLRDNVSEHIGETPLRCAKLEYFNAGGSVKDRIAKRMVEQAERDGIIRSGDTLIEASSGNTGIAIALMAAVKRYKCIIILSEKMSMEKEQILCMLGTRVVRTPAGVPIESPDSIISVAKCLQKEIPNSYVLDRYGNPENLAAHEFGTAEETLYQTSNKVDVVVAGAGAGGTITGLSRGLKKYDPNIILVGVDPLGSVLAVPETLNQSKAEYKVEGIDYDFVPGVLGQNSADFWIKTTDKDAFNYARQLVREEGMLVGGSSGSAIAGLVRLLALRPELNTEGKTIVLIFPDSLRNYLTKFADDEWMKTHGFLELTEKGVGKLEGSK
ncbi:cystathionine beta-synthase [Lentithecium fluviatile CBS 122367]|uniref:cystathionine beta-synthase n=1 Tax=Lentithecium fluviatile CBS 122367 TaxID=1168545 RepID=A0A6G1IFU8_9PLEO|nr:cystathionine beta-synthase [Lentithecium fluviatile CBS 122367]